MFKTVPPPAKSLVNYQDIIIGVYRSLIDKKGTISGFKLASESISVNTDYLQAIGIKPLIKFFASINVAFPEYEMNIENIVIKGEKVMAKYSIWGIQKGKCMGQAPTNSRMKLTGLDIFRFDQCKVVEYWNANHYIEPKL
jgi:predicted ester cyclase